MIAAHILNNTGLIIDICGAALIFFNSPKISYDTFLHNEEELTKLRKKTDRKHRYARTGLALLIVGFTLQLVSNFW